MPFSGEVVPPFSSLLNRPSPTSSSNTGLAAAPTYNTSHTTHDQQHPTVTYMHTTTNMNTMVNLFTCFMQRTTCNPQHITTVEHLDQRRPGPPHSLQIFPRGPTVRLGPHQPPSASRLQHNIQMTRFFPEQPFIFLEIQKTSDISKL